MPEIESIPQWDFPVAVLGLGRLALSPARRFGGDLEDMRPRKEMQSFFDFDRLKSRLQMPNRDALASQP